MKKNHKALNMFSNATLPTLMIIICMNLKYLILELKMHKFYVKKVMLKVCLINNSIERDMSDFFYVLLSFFNIFLCFFFL